MTKVVNFTDLAKQREQRNQPKLPTTNGVAYSTDGKYITLNGIKFSFGGAFQRDFMKNLSEKREQVIDAVLNIYDKELEELKLDANVATSAFVQYKFGFSIVKGVIVKLIEGLQTEEQFNAIFDNETQELALITEIVLAVMHLTYSEFDYQRMLRDRWFSIESSLSEFMEALNNLFDMSILEKVQN